MLVRSAISGLFLMLYLMAFDFYIMELSLGKLYPEQYKLLYNYITAGMFTFCLIDRITISQAEFHKQINLCCCLSMICNYILIILTHHGVLDSPEYKFLLFNGLVFAATLPILIFGGKHGLLKD